MMQDLACTQRILQKLMTLATPCPGHPIYFRQHCTIQRVGRGMHKPTWRNSGRMQTAAAGDLGVGDQALHAPGQAAAAAPGDRNRASWRDYGAGRAAGAVLAGRAGSTVNEPF